MKLLKCPMNQRMNNQSIKVLTEEEWENEVQKVKKKSASSIFSRKTYSVCEWILESKRIIHVLVEFCNMLLREGYFPKRTFDKRIKYLFDLQDSLGWDKFCFEVVYEEWAKSQNTYLKKLGRRITGVA